jgi:hypothetical protein
LVGETRQITSTESGLVPEKVQDLQKPKGKVTGSNLSYSSSYFLDLTNSIGKQTKFICQVGNTYS